MSFVKLLVFAVVPILVSVYFFCCTDQGGGEVPKLADGWWAKGPAPSKPDAAEDSKAPVPFTITTPNATLTDLRTRLDNIRFPRSLDGTAFTYGLHSNFLRTVVTYWKNEFKWERQRVKLNAMPQFKVKIEGIDIHFVRAEPKKTTGKTRRAIMLIHGWPGSFWEFYKLIPMLTDPKPGSDKDDPVAFEVICPSIPGYGFSEAPHKPGFDASDAARIFVKLMKKLGHEKFYVQGGDWGGVIATIMAQAYPENLFGVHVNFAPPPVKSLGVVARQLIGDYFPSLVYSPAEMALRKSVKQTFTDILQESGYMHIQATKPDTVAVGLLDSPAGLAAYILEKYSTWSDLKNRECPDGCITKHFTLEEVLTNVMIYWITESIGSSMRFYKEHFISPEVQQFDSLPVLIPSGLASFPKEAFQHIRSIIELKYHNLVQFTDLPRGGHFAAFEVPELLAADIKSFVKMVEKGQTPN